MANKQLSEMTELVAILFSIPLMTKFLPILLLISSCSTQSDKTKRNELDTTKVVKSIKSKIISDSTNTLTGKIENLELEYIVWGCACDFYDSTKQYL